MKFRFYLWALFSSFILASSCVPTRHLAPNENLLYKIRLEGIEENDPAKITALFQQRPNRKILGSTPYISIYYFGKKFYNPERIKANIEEKRERADKKIAAAGNDSSHVARLIRKKERRLARASRKLEEGNALMAIGEPPVIYDSVKTRATTQQIKTYLNAKGYFKSVVDYQTEIRNKKVTLTYRVAENKPYNYAQVLDSIADPAIKRIVDSTRNESLVRVGQHYDEEILVAERERLENLLKNSGYFHFKKQYISAEVDTTLANDQVQLKLIITNDNAGNPHDVYRLDKVYFVADASSRPERFGLVRDTILYNNIHYLAYNHKISPRILDKKIAIQPSQRYSLTKTLNTQRQLTNLEMFRFININYFPNDTLGTHILRATINATPSKRFQEITEAGVSYSAEVPGPFANLRLIVRNVFRGAELVEIGLRGGLEGQYALNSRQSIYTREFGANLGIIFPQFLVPFRANQYFSQYNPRTRINLAYTDIDRQEFDRSNLEMTFDYIWQKSPRLQYVFTPLDISIINSGGLSDAFRRSLDTLTARNGGQQTTYEKSFQPSFVSSMNFSFLYNSNNYNHTLDAAFFRFFIEEAGLLTNQIIKKEAVGNLKLFEFGRVIADYRRYLKLSRTNFLVSRINIGVARAFKKDDFLPYDKYFFAGGGTSVRAFQPRRLGPGSYTPPVIRDTNGNEFFAEQQGEMLLEGNVEYRFNIFSVMNGAVFVDAGNIWMLTKDPSRPGSQFGKDFYREIAVGTGFGLRFDFTFLIARFDIATKVLDPALKKGSRFVLGKEGLGKITSRNSTTFNLGIGYPF